MAVARRSPIWPIRESSPQRTPTFLLWRSRRTTGWVRAVPGAPPTAPASMGGPDGRSDGIPGKGKGLTLIIQDVYVRLYNVRLSRLLLSNEKLLAGEARSHDRTLIEF